MHEPPPDHSTVSRTRRLIDLETHQAVFTWVLQRLADAQLVKGRTLGIDATTLEANAALRSIVRRDTGEEYDAWLTRRLARQSPARWSPPCLKDASRCPVPPAAPAEIALKSAAKPRAVPERSRSASTDGWRWGQS